MNRKQNEPEGAMSDGDGYGRSWSYRVFSSPYTEPDVPETGRRYLSVHLVSWTRRPLDYPLHEDVFYIDARPASPCGVTLEAALLDAERVLRAFDQPALIKAEWQRFFDHSEEVD
jgi:hypothetical protein